MPYNADGSRPDQEAMRKLSGKGGPIAARWCANCDSHYEYCECAEPDWKLRNEGELGPLPGQAGGPDTMQNVIEKLNHDPRRN